MHACMYMLMCCYVLHVEDLFLLVCILYLARAAIRGCRSLCCSTNVSTAAALGGALRGGAAETKIKEEGRGTDSTGGVKGVSSKCRCSASIYNKGAGGGRQAAHTPQQT